MFARALSSLMSNFVFSGEPVIVSRGVEALADFSDLVGLEQLSNVLALFMIHNSYVSW